MTPLSSIIPEESDSWPGSKHKTSRSPLLSEWICSISYLFQIIRRIYCTEGTRPEVLTVLSVCTVPLSLVNCCVGWLCTICVICQSVFSTKGSFHDRKSQKMAKVAKIPVIDISGDGDQTQVAKELVEAAIEHGFVYIKNSGKDIPAEAVDGAFEMVTETSSILAFLCCGSPEC